GEWRRADDARVSCPLVQSKRPRLRALAERRRVTVAVDSIDVARDLDGIATLVEIDVGVGRCGAQSPAEAVAIARASSDFQGIFYWPSWLDAAGFKSACAKGEAVLDALPAAGVRGPKPARRVAPPARDTPLIPPTTQ